MKLYSDRLTVADLHAYLPLGCGFERFEEMPRPHLRGCGWNVLLYRVGSRRAFNSGTRGAGDRGAASWDDYGVWLARLFERDPEAIVGCYRGREDFHEKTAGKYAMKGCHCPRGGVRRAWHQRGPDCEVGLWEAGR